MKGYRNTQTRAKNASHCISTSITWLLDVLGFYTTVDGITNIMSLH